MVLKQHDEAKKRVVHSLKATGVYCAWCEEPLLYDVDLICHGTLEFCKRNA